MDHLGCRRQNRAQVIPTSIPSEGREIKLELTYTNEFVKKANAKYK